MLHAIADAIDERAADIAAAEALGPGLPVTQSTEQAGQAGGLFRLAADLITAPADDACGPGQSRSVVASPPASPG